MTGEDSNGAECDQVIRDVWLFLDNEMDSGQRETVARHLMDCSPCLDETEVGEKLKELLHRKCGGDLAPDVLRDRLVSALTAQQASQSV